MKNITMIQGDGIGPEISQVTMDIVNTSKIGRASCRERV